MQSRGLYVLSLQTAECFKPRGKGSALLRLQVGIAVNFTWGKTNLAICHGEGISACCFPSAEETITGASRSSCWSHRACAFPVPGARKAAGGAGARSAQLSRGPGRARGSGSARVSAG